MRLPLLIMEDTMSNNLKWLNKRVIIENTTSTEIDGKEGFVEGFYGDDCCTAIVRFDSPLSNGYRSIVIPVPCLRMYEHA